MTNDDLVRATLTAVVTFARLIDKHLSAEAELAAAAHVARKRKAGNSVIADSAGRKVAKAHLAILVELDAYQACCVLWMQHQLLERIRTQYSGPPQTAQQRLQWLSHEMTINRNTFGKMLHRNSHQSDDESPSVVRKYAGRAGRIIDALVDFRLACEVEPRNTKTKWIALGPRGLEIMEYVIEVSRPVNEMREFEFLAFNAPEVEDYHLGDRS